MPEPRHPNVSRPSALIYMALGLSTLPMVCASARAAQLDGDLFSGMAARAIGPAAMSGRVTSIDAVESDPNVIYVGAASGGVWKSIDGGLTWKPIFDDQDYASIGAVAVFQPQPDIVWVGTGEGAVRNSTSYGGGVYKSVDAGRSWTKMGLEGSERIHRIAVHPTDPQIVYVAALGQLWGENQERGIYKTSDGGKSWRRVLAVDAKTGGTDVEIDPRHPDKVLAATWQFRRWPYRFESGGPGSGLWISNDGGESWERKTEEDGLPKGDLGRIDIALSPSDSRVVYALVEAEKSALLRSDDGGESWHTVNDEPDVSGRPFYYTHLVVDPADPNTVYHVESRVYRSIDGGRTRAAIAAIDCCSTPNSVHIDTHAMWVNGTDPRHLIVGNDGGLAISRDGGDTWRFVANLPIGQFYHVNVDDDVPYHVYGGLQDNGTFRGPSEVWENGGIRNLHWQEIGFGDGFDARPDPEDSQQGYSMSQGGWLSRWNLRTGEAYSIRPPPPASGVELRFNWNAAFAQDPFDPATVYYGSQMVHRSKDRGVSWEVISPDLTTNRPEWQAFKDSGGLTPDVTAAENYTTLVAIAPSPVSEGVLWVGSDDGRVHVTRDGGATWQSIEGNAQGAPRNAWVPHIEPSPHDAGTAFVLFDDHRRSDMRPYVYRVEEYGARWSALMTPVLRGYALSFKQDPEDPELLFLGTELGLFVSVDAGTEWFQWTAGVPTVSVMDLAYQASERDLVLGTHGRAILVIDDVRALRGLRPKMFRKRLEILSTTDGQQYVPRQSPSTRFDASASFRAPNEPYGVVVSFVMSGGDLPHPDPEKDRARRIAARAAAQAAAGAAPATTDEDGGRGEDEADKPPKAIVEVRDLRGDLVRTFKTPVVLGINRLVWGLETDGAKAPPRDEPPEDPDVRPPGPEVLPGTYRITVRFGNVDASSEARVLADPRYPVDMAERQAGFAERRRLVVLRDVVVDAIERLRQAAADVDAVIARAKVVGERSGGPPSDDDPLTELLTDGKELRKAIDSAEDRLWNPSRLEGIVYDADKPMSRVSDAEQLLGGTFRGPSPGAAAYLQIAELAVSAAAKEVNDLLQGALKGFQERAQGLGVLPFAERPPLAVPER